MIYKAAGWLLIQATFNNNHSLLLLQSMLVAL